MTVVEDLLENSEASYKKGLLSFWILFSLTERPMYAYEMKEEIEKSTKGSISADDNSIYRAIKRFTVAGIINSYSQPSDSGPNRRYFQLTDLGSNLLSQFIKRNISIYTDNQFKESVENYLSSFQSRGEQHEIK